MTSLDNNLAQRAARGDVEAFARLVRNYSGLVYRVAMRVLGPQDAQDASQEVWLRVWRNLKRFRGDSAFSTWLYKITVNTCLNARRQEQSREVREFGDELPYLTIPIPPGDEYDPEAAVLTGERRAEIFRALESVRVEHRAALVLRHMEGLSYAEVAQILDVPDGTAKGWVSRGRAALLVALSDSPQGDEGRDVTGGAS
jgi:RNA polymerase sigma-70 factor (ECF subfamily)